VFFPIGDYPNPPKPQWVTRILLGINVAVFVFVTMPMEGRRLTTSDLADTEIRAVLDEMWHNAEEWVTRQGATRHEWEISRTKYEVFTFRYGYKPAKPGLLSLFFCMFLHAGFLHLFGNMLMLWIFGDNVEYRLGAVPYLIAYLGTGIIATISFALLNAGSTVPLVGASGAISGVLGFYLIWFPHNRIRVLIFFFFITFIHVRAAVVLVVYLLVDNILPMLLQMRDAGGSGVAHAAHIGGFVAGVIAAFLFNRAKGTIAPPRPAAPQAGHAPSFGRTDAPAAQPIEDVSASFTHAIEHGQMEDAAHAFARLAREGGTRPASEHVFLLANWLYENDFIPDSAAVFRYYIRNFPTGDDLDRVNLGLGLLLARRLNQATSARQYLLAAIEHADDSSNIAETARAELARIDELS